MASSMLSAIRPLPVPASLFAIFSYVKCCKEEKLGDACFFFFGELLDIPFKFFNFFLNNSIFLAYMSEELEISGNGGGLRILYRSVPVDFCLLAFGVPR